MAVKGSCTFCTHSMTVRRLFPPGVRPALPSSLVYCTYNSSYTVQALTLPA